MANSRLPRSLRLAVLRAEIITTAPPRKSKKAFVTGPATKRAQSEKNEQPIPNPPHRGPHVFTPALRTYKSQKKPPSDLRRVNAYRNPAVPAGNSARDEIRGAARVPFRVFLD